MKFNKPKIIQLDHRRPRNKRESTIFGETIVNNDRTLCNVFINAEKNKTPGELIDTFFHEMAHTFIYLYGNKHNFVKQEEDLANSIGKTCSAQFQCFYPHPKKKNKRRKR